MKQHFLVAAASGQIREELGVELRARGYSVVVAGSAAEAEQILTRGSIDSVIIESHLSDASAEELCQRLRQIQPDCRVCLLTSLQLARKNPGELLASDNAGKGYLISQEQTFELLCVSERASADRTAVRGHNSLLQTIDVLVSMRELEERYFGGSSHQVMRLVRAVAEESIRDEDAVLEVVLATLLRDTGRVALSPDVLQSSETLSGIMRDQMNEHVLSSLRLFEHIDYPWKIVPIIRHHHERYDGTGYPDGLRGREIPVGARIIAVVDAYVAMTSHRAHREALTPDQALEELIRHAGHQFDPEVVETFQRVLGRFLQSRGDDKSRVLVIEPDIDFRSQLTMHLVNVGIEVSVAETNGQALSQILEQPPDLVLADADADASETFQMLGALREDEQLRRVPFAVLSGGADRVLKLRALREGVDEFLTKNDDPEELVAHVENILTRERLRRGDQAQPRRGITGSLDHLGLPDIVQTLVIGMKTAMVRVDSNKRSGQLWFENGTPRHAVAGDADGEAAFYEMMRWSGGEFVIEHGVRVQEHTIEQDATFLLMEGMRLLDEESYKDSVKAG